MTGRGRSRGTQSQQQAGSQQARAGQGRGRVEQQTPLVPAPQPVIYFFFLNKIEQSTIIFITGPIGMGTAGTTAGKFFFHLFHKRSPNVLK